MVGAGGYTEAGGEGDSGALAWNTGIGVNGNRQMNQWSWDGEDERCREGDKCKGSNR